MAARDTSGAGFTPDLGMSLGDEAQPSTTMRTANGLSTAGVTMLSRYTVTRTAGGLYTAGFVSAGRVSPQH